MKLFSNIIKTGLVLSGTCLLSFSTMALDSLETSNVLRSTYSLKGNLVLPNEHKDIEPITDNGFLGSLNDNLVVGGYFRGFAYSRSMSNPYGDLGVNKEMRLGEGYFDPFMLMYVGLNGPSYSFGTELIAANPFTVYSSPGADVENVLNVFQALVLRGNARSKYGNFYVVAGGIEWRSLTKFTLSSNTRYQRFSVFERQPWDGVGNLKARYAGYYHNGTYNIDARFGTTGMKGFMVTATDMPLGLSSDIFYGKSQATSGFDRIAEVQPTRTVAVKINKPFKKNRISLVGFNSSTITDSINSADADIPRAQVNMYTAEFDFNHKKLINLNGEIGIGSYESPNVSRNWGEGALAELTLKKDLMKYGNLSFRFYQLNENFVNSTASFSNQTIREVNAGYSGIGGNIFQPFAGSMIGVGDIANNRRSLNLNSEFKLGKFKVIFGNEMSSEIRDARTEDTLLSYAHSVNSLTYSRLPNFFPAPGGLGPNARFNQFYRGVYELVTVTGTPTKRHYNAMDLQVKYRNKIFGKDVYLFTLTSLSTVQKKFSPIVVYSDEAYLRSTTTQTEIYIGITNNFFLDFYYGLEWIRGNDETERGSRGTPRDQQGSSIGIGFDIKISNQSSIFFRQKFFDYEDFSQVNENMKGSEATIEFKTFF